MFTQFMLHRRVRDKCIEYQVYSYKSWITIRVLFLLQKMKQFCLSGISKNCCFNPTTLLLLKFQQCVVEKSTGRLRYKKFTFAIPIYSYFLSGDTSYKKNVSE